jgi:hypothetical protein
MDSIFIPCGENVFINYQNFQIRKKNLFTKS